MREIVYYALGLLAKVLEGIESLVPGMDVHVVTALMVPVVVVTVWFGLHHMKGRILGPMRDGPS